MHRNRLKFNDYRLDQKAARATLTRAVFFA
jgi:hypothetical protein